MSENKEFAYRAEVKYYDEKEKRNMIDFIFCVGPDNAEIDVLDLAYQRFCDKEPDLSKYNIVKYEFNSKKDNEMYCNSHRLSLQAFDYAEIYN